MIQIGKNPPVTDIRDRHLVTVWPSVADDVSKTWLTSRNRGLVKYSWSLANIIRGYPVPVW